jgi:hypothetical protein
MDDANQLVLSANQILPAVLSFRLRVFVWIKEFLVDINGIAFWLEIAQHRFGIAIATTEHNQEQALEAVGDWVNTREKSLPLNYGDVLSAPCKKVGSSRARSPSNDS